MDCKENWNTYPFSSTFPHVQGTVAVEFSSHGVFAVCIQEISPLDL